LWQCELLTTKFDTKMKMNYSYNEMKRAFECGRNFQLTGENNLQELIEELNQALPQADVIKSVCNGKDVRCDNPSMDRNGNCRNCEGDMQTVL
jgi:hypothetical protein